MFNFFQRMLHFCYFFQVKMHFFPGNLHFFNQISCKYGQIAVKLGYFPVYYAALGHLGLAIGPTPTEIGRYHTTSHVCTRVSRAQPGFLLLGLRKD